MGRNKGGTSSLVSRAELERLQKFEKDVKTYFDVLCTDEIRKHGAVSNDHDLAFQVFRVLNGYQEALDQIDATRAQWTVERAIDTYTKLRNELIDYLGNRTPAPGARGLQEAFITIDFILEKIGDLQNDVQGLRDK